MKKRIQIAAVCLTAGILLAACGQSTTKGGAIPTPDTGTPTGSITEALTSTPVPTRVPLSVTDYEACVATTKLPENYMGIKVAKVTDTEVEDYIKKILTGNATLEIKDGTAEMGDVVNIDYVGYENDVAFENGSDTAYDLELGSGMFLDGFEEGLVGAKKGDKIELPLKFPYDYFEPIMRGKNVVFKVTVNEVKHYVEPEFNEEFVAALTQDEIKTIPEFKTHLAGLLTEEKQYNEVLKYLVENSTYDYINETYIQESLEETRKYYTSYAESCQMDLESFLNYAGVSDSEAFFNDLEKQMRDTEKQRMSLYAIAKNENISFTEEDFQAYAAELATESSMTAEDFITQNGRAEIEKSFMMEKALDILINNSVIQE